MVIPPSCSVKIKRSICPFAILTELQPEYLYFNFSYFKKLKLLSRETFGVWSIILYTFKGTSIN